MRKNARDGIPDPDVDHDQIVVIEHGLQNDLGHPVLSYAQVAYYNQSAGGGARPICPL